MSTDYRDWAFDLGRWTKLAGTQLPSDEFDPDPNGLDEDDDHGYQGEDEGPLWVIDVLADGTFSVFASHNSLTDREAPFTSLAEAVRYCEQRDDELYHRRIARESSGTTNLSRPASQVTEPEQTRKAQQDLPFT
jgi:hypothetical protein